MLHWSRSVKMIRLPNSSSARAALAAALVRQVRRNSEGVVPTSVVEMTRLSHRGRTIPSISASTLLGALASLAPGQTSRQLAQLTAGLGQCLLEARRLLVMETLRVGDHDAPLAPEDDLGGFKGTDTGEPLGVHLLVAAFRHCHQVEVVRRR